MLNSAPESLVQDINSGKCVLFVGAGVSQSSPANLPNWIGLLWKLLDWCDRQKIEIPKRTEIEESIQSSKDLPIIADRITNKMGEKGLERFLRETFDVHNHTPVHELIPFLPFAAVITTNFDKLIETAFSKVGRPSPSTPTNLEADSTVWFRNFHVMKLHGTFDNIPSIVLGKNGFRELIRGNEAIRQYLYTMFNKNTILFIGYSLSDPDLEYVLETLYLIYGRRMETHYALLNEEHVDTNVEELIDRYNIHPIFYTPSDPREHHEVYYFLQQFKPQLQNGSANLRGKRIGPYEFTQDSPLVGGFSYVYMAYDHGLKIPVAIKVLKAIHEPIWRERFRNEGQKLAKINHPNVVRVFAIHNEPSYPFELLSMEQIKGPNIYTWRRSRILTNFEDLLNIAIGICNGLEIIHQNDFIHGDISPINILLAETIDSLNPKIIDFGLTWTTSEGGNTQNVGTLLYQAPEQFTSEEVDLRADIYSLGAVLYFLFSNKHYINIFSDIESDWSKSYPSNSTELILPALKEQIIINIKETKPDELSLENVSETCKIYLDRLLQKMLSKKPEDRFKNLNEVKKELENIFKSYNQFDEVYILVAIQEANTLKIEQYPMSPQEDENGDVIYESPQLYVPPLEKEIKLILESPIDRILKIQKARINTNSFKLKYIISQNDKGKLELITDDGNLKQELSLRSSNRPNGSITINNIQPLDILFIIDGSLNEIDYQNTIGFINSLTKYLSEISPLQIGGLIYGAYKRIPYHDDLNIIVPFDIQEISFDEPNEFLKELIKILPTSLGNMGELACCRPLELAFSLIDDLKWRGEQKHVIVIGTHPPYPDSEVRKQYKLLEWTKGEFGLEDIALRYQIEPFHNDGWHFSGIWIKPNDASNDASKKFENDILEYAEDSWHIICNDGFYPVNQGFEFSSKGIELAQNIASLWKENLQFDEIDEKLNIPLLRPIDPSEIDC